MAEFLGLDAYTLQARLAPALAAAAPVALATSIAVPETGPIAMAALVTVTFGGLTAFAVQLVRSAGRRAEQELIQQWGGMPTTIGLRAETVSVDPRVTRRREQVDALYPDMPLVSPSAAARDRAGADQQILGIIERLRTATRDQQRFYLLHAENRQYGFRRNAYGIRQIARAGAVLGLAAAFAFVLARGASVGGVVWIAAQALLLAAWALVPTAPWVREVADRYAEQLFQALEALASEQVAASGGARRIVLSEP